jgi:hypothetical protein
MTGLALSRETYYDVLYRTSTWSRVRYLAIPLLAGLRAEVRNKPQLIIDHAPG